MFKTFFHIVILLYIFIIFKCIDTEEIQCYKQDYMQKYAEKEIVNCTSGCIIEFCGDGLGFSYQCGKGYVASKMTTPCIAHRRDCYENKDKKNQCGKDPLIAGAKIKGLEVICNKTLCNDNKSEVAVTKCFRKHGNNDESTLVNCSDGCVNFTCSDDRNAGGGFRQNHMRYDCYNWSYCKGCDPRGRSAAKHCDKECVGDHICSIPCFEDYCNNNSYVPPTTTTNMTSTNKVTNTTTKMTSTNQVTNTTNAGGQLISFEHKKLRTINGWVHGKAGPFNLSEMRVDSCDQTKGNQISLDMAMKICVQKGSKCTGGLTLCYQSQMSGNVDFKTINVTISRTYPFRLDSDWEIDDLCNQKDDQWKDWVKLKNHGFKLSSDGESVEIQTSYDERILEGKLNSNGCAIFHFNRNKTKGKEGAIWNLKSDEDQDSVDDDDDERKETTTVVPSSPTTTLTDNTTPLTSNNVTMQTKQQKTEEEQEQMETTTDAEQISTDENPETEGPEKENWRENFDEHFWAKLRSGVPLHSFDPLMALPYDVLTGVRLDQEKLFTVVQGQKDGQCQMRVTFHPDCLDGKCLATTNLDGTCGTDSTDEGNTNTVVMSDDCMNTAQK